MLKEERTLQWLQFLTLPHPISPHILQSLHLLRSYMCACIPHERWLLQTQYSCHIRASLTLLNHQTRNVSFISFLTKDPCTASSRCSTSFPTIKVKQSHYRPGQACNGIEAPRFQDNRHKKVARLSALRTGRLYPQELFLVLISVTG